MKNGGTSEKSYNPLCIKCLRSCKQPATSLLVDCPRYYPLPFKVERHRYSQLNLFDGKKQKD
jgi:hypothetical protein